jgi:hypothetical protein
MGAFAALRAAENLREVRDIALITPWNIGVDAVRVQNDAEARERLNAILSGAECLLGATAGALLDEMLRNAEEFDLRGKAPAFASRRVLLVGASEDILTPPEFHHGPLTQAMRRAGARVSESVIACDHVFSAKRNTLCRILLDWLAEGEY